MLTAVPTAHSSLSVTAIVPALSALPAALETLEDLVAGSGVCNPHSVEAVKVCLHVETK